MTSKRASCTYLQVRIICDIWRNEVSPLLSRSPLENKKRKKPVYHRSLTCEGKSALRHEVRMRAWQQRGLGIQNKTDTTAILALA